MFCTFWKHPAGRNRPPASGEQGERRRTAALAASSDGPAAIPALLGRVSGPPRPPGSEPALKSPLIPVRSAGPLRPGKRKPPVRPAAPECLLGTEISRRWTLQVRREALPTAWELSPKRFGHLPSKIPVPHPGTARIQPVIQRRRRLFGAAFPRPDLRPLLLPLRPHRTS